MGSDDVRARAEALLNKMRETGAMHCAGHAGSIPVGPLEKCACRPEVKDLRAALAVAPATAQPVAVRGALDRVGPKETDYAKTFGQILARSICESEPSGEVIEAQDRLKGTDAETFLVIKPSDLAEWVERHVSDAFYDGEITLPLPAPATAVEEARKAFYEACRAAADSHVRNNASMSGTRLVLQGRDMSRTFDALLAAEAAATPKGEARGAARG